MPIASAGYLLWDKQPEILSDRPGLTMDSVRTPCAASRFIAFNQLHGSQLEVLLARADDLTSKRLPLACLVGQLPG